MRFGILGPLQVTVEGETRPLRGRKLRTLLAALLINANETVSADALIEALWGEPSPGERRPGNPLNALQSQVSRLRTVLGPESHRLIGDLHGYRLEMADDELDALAFAAASHQATEALAAEQWAEALAHANTAIELWRGAALEEFADREFASVRARQLEEQRLVTLERRTDARLAMGQHRGLIAELRQLVTEHPLREPIWAQLIVALYRSDRQSEALRAYSELRERLAEELGITPAPELVRLEEQMLAHDPSLQLPPEPEPEPSARTSPTTMVATFLFTEIEHRVNRWDTDPTGTSDVVEQHDTELQTAIEENGGQVFARPGDGFCAVFPHPKQALAAALEAQLSLTGPEASHESLRVHMALATGEASERDGHWSGAGVNRAARLRDASHGGQVLISAAAAELVRSHLPEGCELIDIGRWTVQGLDRPERVHQLGHPDLPSGFPPLRSGRPHTGRLPRHTTSFLGREADVNRATKALGSGRVVTVTGEGGIGKTRLALEIAHRALPVDYPDGVWFCDISGLDDPKGLAEHIAATLQIGSSGGADGDPDNILSRVVTALQDTRLLLVLDGCEGLRDALADLLDRLLGGITEAALLATSRAPLRVQGERVIRLAPLQVVPAKHESRIDTPAVQLLIDRAEAAGAPPCDDEAALEAIARSLDGLPLAIELTAPRLATMSPAELAERLQPTQRPSGSAVARAASQTGSLGSLGPRRKLRVAIDGSFGLLDPPAQDLFALLSVFHGGWTLATAEAVAPAVGVDPDDVALLLTELVDQSMVRAEIATGRTARYRMLDTMRAYAADRLATDKRSRAAGEMHAEHFLRLVEDALPHRRGPLEPPWVEELAVETENLRAAHRWLTAVGRPADALRLLAALADDLLMRERLDVGRNAEELIEHPALLDQPQRATALAMASNTAMVEGRFKDAVALGRAAVEADPAARQPRSWISRNTLGFLTIAGHTQDDWHEHIAVMEAATEHSGDPMPAAVADYCKVILAHLGGYPSAAAQPAEALVTLGQSTRNPSLLAMGLMARGRALSADDPEGASSSLREGLNIATTAHNTLLVQQALRLLSELEARSGDDTMALRSLRTVAGQFERSGNIAEQMQTVITMLAPLVKVGALEAAATLCSALGTTPLQHTAAVRATRHTVATQLQAERYQKARHLGAVMSSQDLVSFASEVAQQLAGSENGQPSGGSSP